MAYSYRQDSLHCEDLRLDEIAEQVGTPCYVYSQSDIVDRYRAYDRAFGDLPHEVCYAVKANSNLSILRLLQREGAGFDIVSVGELYRVLQAGGSPAKIVFSGVGKTAAEMDFALAQGIHTFNCESDSELNLLNTRAGQQRVKARVALRVNPDVDAATHPYISTGMSEHKFGIDITEVEAAYARAALLPNLLLESISCHIGSQMLDAGPLMESIDKMLALVERLRAAGIALQHLDLGGGLGVPYTPSEKAPQIDTVVGAIRDKVMGRGLRVLVEPGRSIVGEAGVLLTRVLYRKATARKQFVIVDAAMNDLIRPALYKSHHEIEPVLRGTSTGSIVADVVGPVCETGDFLARDREMPSCEAGDLLAIRTAGAYGFTQASNYNSRPRSCEVLVDGRKWSVVRKRETLEDLVRGE